jgi:hypothetical protein
MIPFLSPAWICEHHVLLSFVMTTLTIVAVVAGFVLFVLLIFGIEQGSKKIGNFVDYKISYKTKSVVLDKLELSLIGAVLFALISFYYLDGQDAWQITLGLICLLAVIAIGGTMLHYLSKLWIKYVPTKLKNVFGVIFIILMLCFLGFLVCNALGDLYGWWVLKICGA